MKSTNIAKLWLQSKDRRQYQGIVFAPGQQIDGCYNLFQGFATQPREGKWDHFNRHIYEVISNQNMAVYKYIIAWLADLFQNPGGKRPGVALVLRGDQGVGKGVFAGQIGKTLGNHFLQLTSSHQFVGRFNNHLKDALLVFVDEGVWAGDKSSEGAMKAMITEDSIMVEAKGRDAYPIKNHIRLIVASNNSWVVPAGLDERRMLVIKVGNQHQKDHPYFEAIIRQMDDGGREAMLHDLLQADLTGVNLKIFPQTDELQSQKTYSMNSVQKFWLTCLTYGQILGITGDCWGQPIPTKYLHQAYLDFCKDHSERYPLSVSQFMQELGELTQVHRNRPRISGEPIYHVRFEELKVCREKFESKVGRFNWEESENDLGI